MISTRKELKECLKLERDIYLPHRDVLKRIIASENPYKIYRYLRLLRKTEYHYNNKKRGLHRLLYAFYQRRKNIAGRKLGLELWENTFSPGLRIEHCGNIVVNGHCRIGKNCVLHGSNCIGNNGKDSASPQLGDNVRLGVGATIIGNVEIADDVTVAAGAVVINSCLIKGAVLAGVPAQVVKINGSQRDMNA